MTCEAYSMSRGTPQIMSRVVPSWRGSPFLAPDSGMESLPRATAAGKMRAMAAAAATPRRRYR
jgi:hypothetical protein